MSEEGTPGRAPAEDFPRPLLAAFAIIFVLLVAIDALTGGDGAPGGREPVEERELGPSLADPVPYDGRSPREPAGDRRRVLVALPRPALGERPDLAEMEADERRAYVGSLEDESEALRSGLEARGVELGDVVTYERTWNGFAATVRAGDLARLTSLGARTRAVRRFYPAVSEGVPVPAARDDRLSTPDGDGRPVALLGGGLPPLAFLAAGGYDAVDRDATPAPAPDPRDRDRTESSALGPASVLAAAGRRVVPVRVSGLRTAPDGTVSEHGTTDELLDGLERAVDPDGDGDPSDGAAVAVVAVSAPYAGFARAPEAQAVAAARRLGTRVVAPAGHEGPASGPYGTIGSPGGAPAALTVGAATAPEAMPRATLRIDRLTVRGAALLSGAPPRRRLTTAGPVEAERPEDLARVAGRLAGRLVIVRPGENPAAAAAAAGTAGAAAVLLAEERDDVALPAMPAGRVPVPVLGVTGEAARAVLEAGAGRTATVGRANLRAAMTPGMPLGGRPARFSSTGPAFAGHPAPDVLAPATVLAGRRVVAGGAVAAAQVAARLARGERIPDRAGRPPRGVPAPVGRLELARGDEVRIRFTVGAFERGLPTRIVPVERLELRLERPDGTVIRRLTPQGGEQGLLPGEYAYTLAPSDLRQVAGERLRFRVRAWAPRQAEPTERTSRSFAAG